MAHRPFPHFITGLSLALSAFLIVPNLLRAEDTDATADVEHAKHNVLGTINANSVMVRSGPREDAYPTMRLDKGTSVTVVGIKYNWLKILPPEGSFAYVPKVYVQRRGDGSVGRSSREITAWAGSVLNPMKIVPMAKVDADQDVTIIGEQDEYFKIKPPEGSVVYVNKQFVDKVQVLPNTGETPAHPAVAEGQGSSGNEHTAAGEAGTAVGPTTRSSEGALVAEPATPGSTTQPAGDSAAAAVEFDRLEKQYATASNQSITEQNITPLQTAYEALLKQDTLPPSMRQIAQVRVATLKLRDAARQEFLAVKASQEKGKQREQALVAEQQEIQERIKKNNITVYAAVGTLRASSIQHAGQTLYRLTDPSTGHTVAYLRSTDTRYAPMLGQFVGVKGQITSDPVLNMKIIDSAIAVEPVDQAKVNTSVAAQIVPPSLMPRGGQASTGGD